MTRVDIMYHNKAPIIQDKKKDDVVSCNVYWKGNDLVQVLYYNNGWVLESIDGAIINKRIIRKEEKQKILTNYDKKARYIVSAQEKLRY